jgi:hypothetical protein
MIPDRRFAMALGLHLRGHGFRATRTLSACVALASLGSLAACGSSSPPGGQSGVSTGAATGTSTGAGTGASTGTASGVGSGTGGSGAASGAAAGSTSGTGSLIDATIPSLDASTDDSGEEASTPVPSGEAGEPCNADGTCGAGLACSATTTCVPAGASGELCTPAGTCNAGLSCLAQVCTALGDAGEPCNADGSCDPGLFCNPATKACQVSACTGKPQAALPYNISTDFNMAYVIGPGAPNFQILTSLNCDATTFPPYPDTGILDASDSTFDGSFPTLMDGGTEVVSYATPPSCYQFLYNPGCSAVGMCWSGAVITNSAVNATPASPTGTTAGVCIQPGATTVTFMARASANGIAAKFGSTKAAQCLANGYPNFAMLDGGDLMAAPNDPVAQQAECGGDTEFWLALTTSWAQYTVSLPANEPYNDEPMTTGGVWNAFSMVVEPELAVGGAYILVKDVTWINGTAATSDAGSEASTSDAGSEASTSDAGGDTGADGPSE